jgi:hypothetical protein
MLKNFDNDYIIDELLLDETLCAKTDKKIYFRKLTLFLNLR